MLQNRRSFLKFSSTLGVGLLVFPKLAFSAEPTLVKEDETLPKALKYLHDATKSKDRKDPKAICKNCSFYKPEGKIGSDEVGKCQMFQKGVVKAGGWCTSWVKK